MVVQDQVSYVVMGFAGNLQWQLLLARIEEATRQLEAYFNMYLDSYAQLYHSVLGCMVYYAHALFYFLHKTSFIHN